MQQQAGQKLLAHYFENLGGLNTSDSTFTISDGQATGGYNYDYVRTGGIQKSACPSKLNGSADSQLRTLGLALRYTKGSTKSIIRAAGTKIQSVTLDGTFTNLSQDTAATNSDFLASGSTQPVVNAMTTTPSTDILWLAGGGMSTVYGVASDSKVTANGVAAPTGSLSTMEFGGGGAWATTGNYYYAIVYRKASTQALSNAALDVVGTVTSTTNTLQVSWTLTNLDTTLYDKIYIYRSAVGGTSAFTTGDLVAQVDSSDTSYSDTGSYISTAANVPRNGNTILDNSVLPSGTYNTMTLFKRRLVVASGSSVYLSDINKFESWPPGNVIQVPSGGPITGLAIISFTTPSSTTTDEFLAVFKETEVWVITGDSVSDWSLKFVDSTGCIAQPLIVSANGYLYFIDDRGIYLWDGAGKPVYLSRPISDQFGVTGKLERAKLPYGWGAFFKHQDEVIWYLSNTDTGEQQYILKLDLRYTLPNVSNTLGQRIIDGVFLPGKVANPAYAGATFVYPTSSQQEEVFITGDASGNIYRQFYSSAGVGAYDYDFSYETKDLDQEKPAVIKRYEKVIAWVENVGNWDLTVDYWTDFKYGVDDYNSRAVTIAPTTDGAVSLWDVAQWDVAKWDSYKSRPKAIEYNLQAAPYNNGEGQAIKLRFKNSSTNEPILIYGFSILYSEIGYRGF